MVDQIQSVEQAHQPKQLVEEAKKVLRELLGSEEITIDRDNIWELKLFDLDLKIQEAAMRADEGGFAALVELRELVIDERFPLDENYEEEREKIYRKYRKYLETIPRNDYEAQIFARKIFEYYKERLKLQNKHMKMYKPIKVVARALITYSKEGGENNGQGNEENT